MSGNYSTYKNLEIQPKDTKQLIKKIIKNLEKIFIFLKYIQLNL